MNQANVIEQSVTVNAPRASVFHALTDAQTLVKWFPSRAASDPRPGGQLSLGWEFERAEQNGTQSVEYVDVQPNERVAYHWHGGPGAENTLVSFDLAGGEQQTVVSLKHSGWPAGELGVERLNVHAGPWQFYLANLKSFLESGQDSRAAALGQKVPG